MAQCGAAAAAVCCQQRAGAFGDCQEWTNKAVRSALQSWEVTMEFWGLVGVPMEVWWAKYNGGMSVSAPSARSWFVASEDPDSHFRITLQKPCSETQHGAEFGQKLSDGLPNNFQMILIMIIPPKIIRNHFKKIKKTKRSRPQKGSQEHGNGCTGQYHLCRGVQQEGSTSALVWRATEARAYTAMNALDSVVCIWEGP